MSLGLRENDVYSTPEGVYYRFLRRNREDAYIIELGKSAATLACVDWYQLSERLETNLYVVRPYQGVAIAHNAPSAKDEAHRQRRQALIEPLLKNPALFERKGRTQLIADHATKNGVSQQTVRTCLTLWFQGGQTPDALLTNYKSSGKPKPEESEEKRPPKKPKRVDPDFVGPPSPFAPSRGSSYKTTHRSRPFALLGARREAVRTKLRELYEAGVERTTVYRCVIEALFRDSAGEWLPEWCIPSHKQIRYLWNEVTGFRERLVQQHGRASVENNQKPLTGSVLQHAVGAGYVYEIDSTIADIWICSRDDRFTIIGKATCYFVVCRWSRAIVGFHLTLDKPSWAGAKEALCTVVMDKRKLCELWGAKYDENAWVSGDTVCFHVVADRGSEMVGVPSDQVAENVNIGFTVMPAQMSVLKGMVECTFKLIHQHIRENLPGYELPQNIFARQKDKNYEQVASRTLDEVAVELIDLIGVHNNYIYTRMERDAELAGTLPTPRAMWAADMYRRSGMHRGLDEDWMRSKLRPRKRCVVRREGIKVNGLYYHCDRAYEDEWFERAASKRFRMWVSYERGLTDFVWIHNPEWGDEPVKATLAPRSAHFRGLCVREAMAIQYIAKLAIEGATYANDKAKAAYARRAKARSDAASAELEAARAEHAGESRMRNRTEMREAEAGDRARETVEYFAGARDAAQPGHDGHRPPPAAAPHEAAAPGEPKRPVQAKKSPPHQPTAIAATTLASAVDEDEMLSAEQMERIALGLDD
jgi:hypothetical protein